MRYEHSITSFPKETSGYQVPAFTEGNLRVLLNEAPFFDADGILLAELAIVLAKWLRAMDASGPVDLYYASMDFEEEPILALRYEREGDVFIPQSVWALGESSPISRESAVRAARDYIERLREEIRVTYAVDLQEIIEDAVSRGE